VGTNLLSATRFEVFFFFQNFLPFFVTFDFISRLPDLQERELEVRVKRDEVCCEAGKSNPEML